MRRRHVGASSDVALVVHEEFVRWFGASTAGALARYDTVATDLWELWSASLLDLPAQK